MQIINLTPHPVTIIRTCPDPTGAPADMLEHRTEYPACAPEALPRAIEERIQPGLDLIHDDTQGAYATLTAYASAGLVDLVGYTGVTGLPEIPPERVAFGVQTAYIVSIVTAIGALVVGRPTCDLLIPMGQVRDASGRVIGATSLAPADVMLQPMAAALRARWTPARSRSSAARPPGA